MPSDGAAREALERLRDALTTRSTTSAADAELAERLAADGDPEALFLVGVLRGQAGESPEAWLRPAAAVGHREAMHALGSWHGEHADDEVHRGQAIRWLGEAAEQGDVDAAVELAELLAGLGEPFAAAATRAFERAATLGDALSIVALAGRLAVGIGVPADAGAAQAWYARAAKLLEAAARQDDDFAPFAMCQLAELHLDGNGVDADPARALALYEEAAARNHSWAMLSLATCYERGTGVPRDLARAESWLERAVDAGGGPYAQSRLDDVRAAAAEEATTVDVGGARVPKDLLEQAEGGDARAMYALADLLGTGGLEARAREWLERSARGGSAVAAFRLFLETMGADAIGETARAWRRLAAGRGHVSALHMIGDELLDPESGLPLDPPLGYAWLAMATRERHDQPPSVAALQRRQAAARAADVWASLSADQRSRAQAIVDRCDQGPPFRLPDEP